MTGPVYMSRAVTAEKGDRNSSELRCVMPNPHDVATIFEVVRNISGSTAPPKRVQLGRRAWALLGRRLHDAQIAEARKAGVPESGPSNGTLGSQFFFLFSCSFVFLLYIYFFS